MIIKRIEPFGSLVYHKETETTLTLNRQETKDFLNFDGVFPKDLSSPQFVHIEISNRCNLNCSYCYVKDKIGEELTNSQLKEVIKDLAKNKVFQITFGGGEPFLREDLYDLAEYTQKIGMNLGITTNGLLVKEDDRLSLFNQINFSIHNNFEQIKKKILMVKKYTKVGINFVVRKDYLKDLKEVADFCLSNDIEILLLTYKTDEDFENVVKPKDVYYIGVGLVKFGVKVAIDGLTCNKCMASKHFVDIDSLGNVFCCSFIRKPMGNVLRKPFKDIWENRTIPKSCPYEQV